MNYETSKRAYNSQDQDDPRPLDLKKGNSPLLQELYDKLSTEVSRFNELNFGIKQKIRAIHIPQVTEAGVYSTTPSNSIYAGSMVEKEARERTLIEKLDQLYYEFADAVETLQKTYIEICNIV